MKNGFTFTIIALVAMNLGLYGQEKGAAQVEAELELKVVYEKTFDEPIVDVIFDTATVSIEEAKEMGWKEEAFSTIERRQEKVRVSYPKIVTISPDYNVEEVKVYDKNGTLKKALSISKMVKYESVNISSNKKYILVSRIPTEYSPQYSGGILYDDRGKKNCEVAGPTPIAVSNEGYMVAAYLDWQVPAASGGDFYIYNNQGKLLKTIENPNKKNTAPMFARYSDNGEYAIIIFKRAAYSPTAIVLINKTGEVIWKREFPEIRFSARKEEIDFTPSMIIGIWDNCANNWQPEVFAIDFQGTLKWTCPLEVRGNMITETTRKEDRVFIGSGTGYLWCVSTDNGKVIWLHQEDWSPAPVGGKVDSWAVKDWSWEVPRFRELKIVNNTLYIIGRQGRPWHSSTLFVFDIETGDQLMKVEYPQERITFAQLEGDIGLMNITKKNMTIFKQEDLR